MSKESLQPNRPLAELKDEEILTLSFTEPNAFGEIFERYHDAFVRKAKTIVASEEAAEDVVQEVFVKIYIKGKRFKAVEGATFKSWAYKVLLNTCFTAYRKLAREKNGAIAFDEELEAVISEDGGFAKRLHLDYFMSLISRLPEALRQVLRLGVVEGKTAQEIAVIEGVSVGAVRTRLHRAKRAFQRLHLRMI